MKDYVLLICTIVLFGVLYFLNRTNVTPQPGFLLQGQYVVQDPSSLKFRAVANAVNRKNRQVATLVCEDIDIRISGNQFVRLSAKLHLQKDRYFRMITRSLFGKESDVGSNDQNFWFWSRRMNPPALHYADYKDILKTRLKTPFNPVWIMQTLGVHEISLNNGTAFKRGKYWELRKTTRSAVGKRVVKVSVIDPDKLCVVGHYIYENDEIIASAEVYEHVLDKGIYLPKKMLVTWYKEKISLVWTFNNPQINIPIDSTLWVMPQMKQTINMGEQK